MKLRRHNSAYDEEPQRAAGPPLDVVFYNEIPEPHWVHLGELNSPDPFAEPPDYSKARIWRPLCEIIEERTRIPWWLRS
jgi:hypothetical protein